MKTYHQSMDELHFTPEEKEAMTERLLKASQAPVHRVRPLRRMAAVGVAAALVLTVGVGAAATGVLKSAGEAFSEVFGGAPAQTEIIDRIGRPVGASDMADGVVITADAIVGDRYSYAIVYTIAREDGKPLAEDLTPNAFGYLPLRFESADVDVGQQGGSHGASYFFDADPEDNAVQYVDLRTGDTPLTPGTAWASFRNLSVYTDNDYTKSTPVAQGKWKMRFGFLGESSVWTVLPSEWDGGHAGLGGPLSALLPGELHRAAGGTVGQRRREWPTERPRPGGVPALSGVPPRGTDQAGRHHHRPHLQRREHLPPGR